MDFVKTLIKPFDRKSRPGAVPGTVVTKKDEPAPVIDVIFYNKSECIENKEVTLSELEKIMLTIHLLSGSMSGAWVMPRSSKKSERPLIFMVWCLKILSMFTKGPK